MSKRKYDSSGEGSSDQTSPKQGLSKKRKRAQIVLDHGKTSLFRAFKVARGFERQKLGRRLKTATREKQDVEKTRIEEETASLKVIHLRHVSKTLLTCIRI